MAISIDAVYQKVLVLANKEQRGYITPQEFNLLADHAQMEIFEQYFYDLDQFQRLPGTTEIYADKIKNLREKTNLFQTYSPSRCELVNSAGWMNLYNHMHKSEPEQRGADLYRLGKITVTYKSQGFNTGVEAEYIDRNKLTLHNSTKLLKRDGESPSRKHRYTTPTYSMFDDGVAMRIQIHPYPTRWYQDNNYTGSEKTFVGNDGNLRVYPDLIQIFYTRKPKKPNWAYVVVNDKPLYNSTSSTDFELHASEETELVYRILTLAGVAIEKPQLTQVGAQLTGAQIQQEKQ
tara:strand:- start:1504 stop:2373 length:870 start_codon:yes stop_codon:yes gene_type:complete